MKYTYFLAIFFCFAQHIASQNQITTSVKATEVIDLFAKGSTAKWAVPVSQTERVALQWYERKNSFSEKEGIRTFVGYQDSNLVASLSIRESNVSIEVTRSDNNIHINTNAQGFLVLHSKENNLKCGVCTDGSCSHSHHKKTNKTLRLATLRTEDEKKIANRDVLFVYRLALPIAYGYFSDPNDIFKSNVENVKRYWANMETQLNEAYTRDLGIKFKVVNDERLIIQTPNGKKEFDQDSSGKIISVSTKAIDELIGRENYDLGVVISKSFNYVASSGLAYIGAAYGYHKGGAVSITDFLTLVHEIGHMFGSDHTFTTDGSGSYNTETGWGQSIMSYGYPADFFSLVSVYYVRNFLKDIWYYQDEGRKNLIKESINFDHINHPYGISVPNQAPVIDQSKLKKEYKIPQYTNFQFRISATDPDDTDLMYMAQPADINKKKHAKFYTYKGTNNNTISFEPSYNDDGGFDNETRHFVSEGDFTFWLGVNDANLHEEKAVKYDIYQTKVKIIKGTSSFDFITIPKKEYKVGEKITLKWNVDKTIFDTDSKVRILLSDDLGKTYKHTIVASTENDGEYEFTIPNILVGETEFGKKKKINLPAGVFKVEVIEHIAYAKTNTAPYKFEDKRRLLDGGFKIVPSDNPIPPLTFVKLPENVTISCTENIPEKENLQVSGGCNPNIIVSDIIKNQTCAYNYTIERTYSASDNCGSMPIAHTQIITIKDEKKPTFNENLPEKEIVVEEGSIPAQATLTATDNCSINISVVASKQETTENGNKVIIYKWEASDECGNTVEHTQKIRVISPEIKFVGDLPQNIIVSCEKDISIAPILQVSGGCNPKIIYNGDTKSAENCKNSYMITRTWTASNDCGKAITHTQIITIKDEEKPTFNENLPEKEIVVEEGSIPAQATLTATDNCSINISVVASKQETTENGNKVIIYKWEASDECGNTVEHTQKILVKEIPKPTPPVEKNDDKKLEIIVYNGVSTDNSSENYFKIEPFDQIKNISVEIFNELGQKVYQSKNYQQNGESFRGIANVSGVVAKGKRLPSGTYFYILKYQDLKGISHDKKGFLFVR